MKTKDNIIYESLKLFSILGFEAVSTRMIAKAVHGSDALIYKHFKNKQEILDTIVAICTERFLSKRQAIDFSHICWEDAEKICMDMFEFQTEDEWIVLFRRLLILEQFKNEKMAQLYRKFFIDSILDDLALLFEKLMVNEYLKPGNPKIYAMELYAPFFMYHTLNQEKELLRKELKIHVSYFEKNYRNDRR
ncbi:MAG: TetR/AcrR family transcriptional regulator, repressor for uid operon [Clostridiales bacterium]|nr:TetR/AcrR family transcriptional regulator, repressor for uid operon [Clostridiales bacterium]